jgi:F0F1-type ATP synthase gamma subunit
MWVCCESEVGIYIWCLVEAEAAESHANMLRMEAASNNTSRRIEDRAVRINRGDVDALIEVELYTFSYL